MDERRVSIELSRVAKKDKSASVVLGPGPVRVSRAARADIVFVIDTTGSMDDKIQGLLAGCQKFVDEVTGRQIDWRVAIVSFGDLTVPGDKIEATTFSSNAETVKYSLRNVPRNSGGGNTGESSLDALTKALGLGSFRQDVIKVFVLITDEPALQSQQITAESVTEALKDAGVLTFVVSDPINYYKDIATSTGGTWFQVSRNTDFLPILDVLGRRVSEVVSDVQRLAAGSVRTYLELRSGR